MKKLLISSCFLVFGLLSQAQSIDISNADSGIIALQKRTVKADSNVQLADAKAILPQHTEGVLKPDSATKTIVIEKPKAVELEGHPIFNSLLEKHVSTTGKVNYKGFKADKTTLMSYIEWLQNNVPTESTTKNDRMAYWINAYNALTIKLIVENYPLNKITNLDGGKTWDVKRNKLGDKKYSLNDIENNILRPMGDARIHFAINCAAKSCPPILNKAFTADNLEELLENRTRQFINSAANTLKANEIKVSKIFDWYGKDFGNVAAYVAKYAKVKVSKNATVSFNDYDWSLNE
jgi:hypothetical protein